MKRVQRFPAILLLMGLFLVLSSVVPNNPPTAAIDYSTIEDNRIIDDVSDNIYCTTRSAFIENKGQINPSEVLFYYQGPEISFLFADRWWGYVVCKGGEIAFVKVSFVNSNGVLPMGNRMQQGVSNYILPQQYNCSVAGVQSYSEIVYQNIWDDIDLIFNFASNKIKYSFCVHPGGRTDSIRLSYEGIQELGINRLTGDLTVRLSPTVMVSDECPIAFQETPMGTRNVRCEYKIRSSNEISYDVSKYDEENDLIIDPGILFSSYIGGSSFDASMDSCIDKEGNIIVIGETSSTDFPTTPSAFDTIYNSSTDIVVSKFSETGDSLIFSTYIGASSTDRPTGICTDDSGNIMFVGYTSSQDFPVTADAFDTTFNGGTMDAIFGVLDATGSILRYSTYLGGTGFETAEGITMGLRGDIFIYGNTRSEDFPSATNALNVTNRYIYNNVFVCQFVSMNSYLFSALIGGTNSESIYSLLVVDKDRIFCAGITSSSDFPITGNAIDPTYNGGGDSFFTLINTSGPIIEFSTFFGGSERDNIYGGCLDLNNDVILVGPTWSPDYPCTYNLSHQIESVWTDDCVIKVNLTSLSIVFSTLIGGDLTDWPLAVDTDGLNNIYLCGETNSSDYPTTSDAFCQTKNGYDDIFLTCISPEGDQILYSTYIGGGGGDLAGDISIDDTDCPILVGFTNSSDLPLLNNPINHIPPAGSYDGYIIRLDLILPDILHDISPTMATTGDNFRFNARIHDNDRISEAQVEYWAKPKNSPG